MLLLVCSRLIDLDLRNAEANSTMALVNEAAEVEEARNAWWSKRLEHAVVVTHGSGTQPPTPMATP
jgi:hypothetical protein